MKTKVEPDEKLVIVIDDDPLVLEATTGLLNSWGFQVVSAESYAAVLDKLTQLSRSPDLIICDYRLSEGKTGIDVIQQLRSVYNVPALLISGDPLPGEEDDSGCGYRRLQKPLDVARFRAALVGASVLQR